MSGAPAVPSQIIRASAGTGKTYQLTRQLLAALLLPGASERPERLLAMTFTRAAAGEIRDRLLGELAEAAADDAAFEEMRPKLPAGTTRDQLVSLLLELVERLDRMRISTIDAFFMTLARAYAFDLEMPPDWRIADEMEIAELRLRALEDVWETLKPEEVATVLFQLSQGAPSTQVTETLIDLLKESYELVRETGSEAWDWLHPVVDVARDEALTALRMLSAATLGGTPSFDTARLADVARFEAENWKAFLGTGVAKSILAGNDKYGSAKNVIDARVGGLYEPLIAYARGQLVLSLAARTREIRSVVVRYQRALQVRRQSSPLYGFGDIAYRLRIGGALGLLDVMSYRLDGRLDHLLIDEFQDTSMDQWDVLLPLAEAVTSGGDTERSLMCVGDVKQSLYAWRGGRAELLERLTEQLPAFSGDVRSMSETRRSSPVVLELVNAVFESLESNPALRKEAAVQGAKRWCRGFEKHSAFYTDRPGAADLRVVDPEEDPVLVAAELAREIHKARPEASIGILVRGNTKGQIATLVRALGEGTPAVAATGRGGNPLSDSVAVELVLSLLTLLDQPRHSVARFHVWRSPLGRMIAPGSDPLQEPDGKAFGAFAIKGRARVIEVGYAQGVREWIAPLLGEVDAYDLERLSQLLDMLASPTLVPTLRPSDLVQTIRGQKVPSSSASHVQVMTIHQSKGLEFDVVILPDLGGDLVRQDALLTFQADPLQVPERVSAYAAGVIAEAHPALMEMRDAQIAQAVQSSLCVLYVALTRAKHATHCIIEPSSKSEKALRMSYAGLLRGALTDLGQPAIGGEMLWSAADSDGAWELGSAPETQGPVDEISVPWTSPKVAGVRRRNLPRTSPSRLEGDVDVSGGRVLATDTRALVRGTVVHGWLEALPWCDALPEPAELVEAGIGMGATRDEAQGWANDFVGALVQPTLAALLKRPDTDVEVRVEQPFEMTVERGSRFGQRLVEERTLVAGSIDRLVIHRSAGEVRRVEVIDYKTDVLNTEDPGALAERLKHYAPQLAVYRLAASRLLGCSEDQVETSLMFLHTDARVACV
jgi:ATP-dependent helicase/nuclease subunit A